MFVNGEFDYIDWPWGDDDDDAPIPTLDEAEDQSEVEDPNLDKGNLA